MKDESEKRGRKIEDDILADLEKQGEASFGEIYDQLHDSLNRLVAQVLLDLVNAGKIEEFNARHCVNYKTTSVQ